MSHRVLTEADIKQLAERKVITMIKRIREVTVKGLNVQFEDCARQFTRTFLPLGMFSYSASVFNASYIGRYCSIAPAVSVMGHHHPVDWVSSNPLFYSARVRRLYSLDEENTLDFAHRQQPVHIGHDVWIGQNVLLRDGIKIGDGCIVAAGSVVTKDLEPYGIYGRNPARLIRPRFDQDIIDDLVQLKWWQYDVSELLKFDYSNPREFIDAVAKADLDIVPENRLSVDEYHKKHQKS